MALSQLLALLAVLPAIAGDAFNGDKRQAFRLWDEGVSAALKDLPEEARVKWRQCLALDPDNRDCRAGLKLLGVSAPAGSIPVLPPPASADPKSARRLFLQGQAQFHKGKNEEAARFWRECLAIEPGNIACQAGLKLVGAGAREATSAALPPDPKEAVRLWNEGLVYFQKMQYESAANSWMECLRKNPQHPDCRTGLARVTDYLPQNVSVSGAASPRAPVGVSTAGEPSDDGRRRAALRHWHAGIIYFQAGKIAQARDEWRLCAEFDPANSDCSTGLTRIDSSQ